MGKPAPYLFQKRGIYYLQKRVPQQLIPKLGRVIIRKSTTNTTPGGFDEQQLQKGG